MQTVEEVRQGIVLEFELPGVVVSANASHAPRYSSSSGRMEWQKSDEWLNWVAKVRPYIPQKSEFKIAETSFVAVSFIFHYEMYWPRSGALKKKDSSNMLKVLLDVISKKLGFDDARVVEGRWKAEHFVGDAWVDCRLEELPCQTDSIK